MPKYSSNCFEKTAKTHVKRHNWSKCIKSQFNWNMLRCYMKKLVQKKLKWKKSQEENTNWYIKTKHQSGFTFTTIITWYFIDKSSTYTVCKLHFPLQPISLKQVGHWKHNGIWCVRKNPSPKTSKASEQYKWLKAYHLLCEWHSLFSMFHQHSWI